jgi:hypothetical protein
MNRAELIAMLAMHEGEIAKLRDINTGCAGCAHFGPRVCTRWGQPVPVDHQESGCDSWQWDDMPKIEGRRHVVAPRKANLLDENWRDLDDDIPF